MISHSSIPHILVWFPAHFKRGLLWLGTCAADQRKFDSSQRDCVVCAATFSSSSVFLHVLVWHQQILVVVVVVSVPSAKMLVLCADRIRWSGWSQSVEQPNQISFPISNEKRNTMNESIWWRERQNRRFVSYLRKRRQRKSHPWRFHFQSGH